MAKKQSSEAKAPNDAYAGMLAISLVALIVGCLLLYLDYSQYGSEPPPVVASAPAAPLQPPGVLQQPVAPVQQPPQGQPPMM